MTDWQKYVELVESGTIVYHDLARIVRNSKRRPEHISEYTWMSDIDNRANGHLADRRLFWMYRPITGMIAYIFSSGRMNDVIICELPRVYGVATGSMLDKHAIAVYDVMIGLSMIYEVMLFPLTQRTQTNYLDSALNKLYDGVRSMSLTRFGVDGLQENRITTRTGGGDFNLRLAIETCGLTSPFGKCMQLWAYELNYALQRCWSYQSIATDIIEPFLYTILMPPEQLPLPRDRSQRL
jgi:hypothetical protein